MFFTSYEFLGFFLVLFLLYYFVFQKYQWQLLLAASYFFYFIANRDCLIYILVTTVTVYWTARTISENQKAQAAYLKEHKSELNKEEKKLYKVRGKKICRRWLIFCLLINIGILAVLKYSNFFLSNVNKISELFGKTGQFSFVSLILPLGISFYTFQAVGYLIDVYRGTYPAENNLFRCALFVSFFPLLIQGPISNYGELSKTLYRKHRFEKKTVCYGLQRMLWGYFKKMIIADRMLAGVSSIISDPGTYHGAYIFAGMIFYTLELYADFTGGIDITIGIAETFGIRVQENFNRPYFSKSLKEYWRRWHISMCTWFRNYVFYPVSTSKLMQKFSKFSRKRLGENIGRRIPVYISSFVVWFATGIWHGASYNFIVWGLANWFVLMVSEEFESCYDRFHERFRFSNTRGYRLFQIARTFLLICILNLFDCYESVKTTLSLFASVFTAKNWNVLFDGSLLEIGLSGSDYAVLAAGVIIMTAVSLLQRKGSVRDMVAEKAFPVRVAVWFGMFFCILIFGIYGIGYDASQFIYNRF